MAPLPATRIETYQLEGQDSAKRVFNRHIEINRGEAGYTSVFFYEGKTFSSHPQRTIKECLNQMVESLQQFGFRQLRSRLNFRGKRYLAEREPWSNYQDVPETSKK